MRKIGVMRSGITSPTKFEFQPEFVTNGFQRSNLTYIILAYKVIIRQVSIISYSSFIQIIFLCLNSETTVNIQEF